jgi:hypothetical protein
MFNLEWLYDQYEEALRAEELARARLAGDEPENEDDDLPDLMAWAMEDPNTPIGE